MSEWLIFFANQRVGLEETEEDAKKVKKSLIDDGFDENEIEIRERK